MQKFLLLFFLLGCPQPVSPTPDADATTPAVDGSTTAAEAAPSDACGLAEQNLNKLGCKDPRGRLLGGPNLHGDAWSTVCRTNRTNGVDMKPECLMQATSCAAVEACR